MPLTTSGVPSRAAIQAAIDESIGAALGGAGRRMQMNVATISITAASSGNVDVVYPEAFSAIPRVYISNSGGVGSSAFFLLTGQRTTTGFRITAAHRDATAVNATITVEWLAIGQR